MSARRLSVLFALTALALAETNPLLSRLQLALKPSGEDLVAAQELANRNYAALQRRLARRAALATGDGELVALQGAVAFLAGDTVRAIADFERASKIAALEESDSFTLAMALVRSGADEKAAAVLADLDRSHPAKPIYLYWLGRIDYDLRRYDEAVEKLRRTVELDPQWARAWDALGLTLDMQGQMEQAFSALSKARDLNRSSKSPSAWPPNDLGSLCLRMNRWAEAESALREALRYDARLPQAHYHLARALEKQGRDTEAIPEYHEAILEDAKSSDACYSLAMLYRRQNRDREANEMFALYKKRKQAEGRPVPAPN